MMLLTLIGSLNPTGFILGLYMLPCVFIVWLPSDPALLVHLGLLEVQVLPVNNKRIITFKM